MLLAGCPTPVQSNTSCQAEADFKWQQLRVPTGKCLHFFCKKYPLVALAIFASSANLEQKVARNYVGTQDRGPVPPLVHPPIPPFSVGPRPSDGHDDGNGNV